MSIIDNLLSRAGYVKAKQKYPQYLLAQSENARFSIPDGSLYATQASLYQKLTWIATAIDTVAEACALVPFSVYQREGEDKSDIPNHPFEIKLDNPNPMQSRFEFFRDYFAYRKLTGNAYVYLNRGNENEPPSEYWIIPTHLIKPEPDGQSYIKGYVFDDNGRSMPLETWQVMHDKTFNPLNPFVGLSAIESLAMVAKGDLAQQAWETKLFAKDNAKVPGAIAFADMINNVDWERLQVESKEQWGGTNRSGPMWLRGVGAGGVQWVQMALSQKDMEFIQQRQFTKEEIWSKLAPGLASILSVNATEANALAGKAIFSEYGLWPMLVQAAQKITSTILPAYGENLIGEFDDIRKSDRLMDLDEQREYAKVHTVNEVRSEYYSDDEIEGGDVPVGVWGSSAQTVSTTESSVVSGGGLDVSAEATILNGAQIASAIEVLNGVSNGTVAELVAIELLVALGIDNERAKSMVEASLNVKPLSVGAEIQTELKAWETFALRRLGKVSGREFEPRAVPIMQAARIKAALKQASTVEMVQSVFYIENGIDSVELKRANDLLERALAELEGEKK